MSVKDDGRVYFGSVALGPGGGEAADGGEEQAEVLGLSAGALRAQELHAEKLRALEVQRRGRGLQVPTEDVSVKMWLRELGAPICLFGERPGDRRSRLQTILAENEVDDEELKRLRERLDTEGGLFKHRKDEQERLNDRKKTFYTKARPALVEARKRFAEVSWKKAEERILKEKKKLATADAVLTVLISELEMEEKASQFELNGSQVGDRRPVSCCTFATGGRFVSGSFSGALKVWNDETFEQLFTLKGHEDRVVDVASFNDWIVSGSADTTMKLWKLPENPRDDAEDVEMKENDLNYEFPIVKSAATLRGHPLRLSRVAWHPLGAHIGSSSFDHSWRLWDVERTEEVLLQEGHEYPVYAFAFHPDGGLAVSGDFMGVTRLWDLRSGKAIDSLVGHATRVLGADFSPNGVQLVTGSSENLSRVWDLRMHKTMYILPGHTSIVRDVGFNSEGSVVATSSFDGGIKLWSMRKGMLLKELRAHESMVMGIAWKPNEPILASSSYDRTFKFWGPF